MFVGECLLPAPQSFPYGPAVPDGVPVAVACTPDDKCWPQSRLPWVDPAASVQLCPRTSWLQVASAAVGGIAPRSGQPTSAPSPPRRQEESTWLRYPPQTEAGHRTVGPGGVNRRVLSAPYFMSFYENISLLITIDLCILIPGI